MIRNAKRQMGLILRGFCMGAADIVPGVSGGTMAFILGIYEELIDSIRTFGTPQFWRLIVRGNLRAAVQSTNLPFLIPVFTGILLAVVTLSQSLETLLHTKPILVWSFFFGLVFASVIVVVGRVRSWNKRLGAVLLLGMLLAYLLVGLVPVQTPESPWYLIMSGAIAICAMILPGISGSFLLVLLGKYEFILAAVNARDLVTIGYVGIGAVTGLIIFTQFLSWVLHHYHDLTIAFLTGLMIGSLRKIWPWKEGDDLLGMNTLPEILVNGQLSNEFLTGISLMILGVIVVLALERFAKNL